MKFWNEDPDREIIDVNIPFPKKLLKKVDQFKAGIAPRTPRTKIILHLIETALGVINKGNLNEDAKKNP